MLTRLLHFRPDATGTDSSGGGTAVAPLETHTPGEVVGETAGGVAIVAGGVKPGQPATDVDVKAAGKAFLASLGAESAEGEGEEPGAVAPAKPAKKPAAKPAAQAAPAPAKPAAVAAVAPIKPAAVAAKPAAPAAPAAVAPAGETAVDETPLAANEHEWDPTIGRWRNATGAFVEGAPPTDDELAAAGVELGGEVIADPAGEGEEPGETEAAPAEPATPAIKITLPGVPERGEPELDVEITDPVLAERLKQLANNGMRRQAYQEAKAKIDQQQAELDAVDQALTIDPVGFALNRMTRDRQLEVARALVLEHFDELLPDMAKWDADAAARQEQRVALRDNMKTSEGKTRQMVEGQQRAAACMRTAESLIPESIDPSLRAAFMADAEQDLLQSLRAGRLPTPELVPQLLARRISLYGFASSEPGAPNAAPVISTSRTPAAQPIAAVASATARPVTDRAKAIADQRAAVSAQQVRIRRIATARQSAARIPSPGVGAATVSVPVVPEDVDVRGASKALRKSGRLPDSWAPA